MLKQNCLLAVTVFGFGLSLFAGDAATEAKKLEGQWTLFAAEKGGKKAPPEFLKTTAKIADGKMTMDSNNPEKKDAPRMFSLTLDPTKEPKAIDLDLGEGKGRIEGIYKLSGDELTLCFSAVGGAERPNKFASPDGTQIILFTWKKK